MKQEDKELLLKYLCMALPYKIVIDYSYNAFKMHKGNYESCIKQGSKCLLDCDLLDVFMSPRQNEKGEYFKPYLRPLSSMTEEELVELNCLCYHNISIQDDRLCGYICGVEIVDVQDFLLRYHFDFMELIPRDLAIAVTEENNPYNMEA